MTPTKQAMEAVMAVHKAFGAPGDYGYGTKQGDALLALYQAHDALANESPNLEAVTASASEQLQKADVENLRLREDMEAAQTAFVILHEKWLTAEKRQDMNEAMDGLAEAFRRGSLNEEIDGFIPCPHCGRDPESATCHCKPEEDFEG